MFNKMLAPLDGSTLAEGILPYAAALAKAVGSSITLCYVADLSSLETPFIGTQMPHRLYSEALKHQVASGAVIVSETGRLLATDAPDSAYQPHLEQLQQNVEVKVREYLVGVRKRLAPSGVALDEAVLFGLPAEQIASYAQNQGYGVIAMSTHGRSGLGRWAYGSVSDKVLRMSPVPVLLYRSPATGAPGEARAPRALIVPLDGSTRAEGILPYAEELAKKGDMTVHLLRVATESTYAYWDPAWGAGSWTNLEQIQQDIQQAAREYLERVQKRLERRGVTVVTKVLRGGVAWDIIDYAKDTPRSLVAMSTHGRSGVGRWLLGSVAEKVLQAAVGPVLIIRPKAGRKG